MTHRVISPIPSAREGFSLVEISIVLVIIGLLAGAVLAGQSLIHSARLRNTIGDITEFRQAITFFHEQYAEYPGDMPTATQNWGKADGGGGDGTGADCRDTISTDKTTCDGDGDGKIETADASTNEALRLWQHLANAELLENKFTGAFNASGDLEAGTNVPEAPVNGGVYEVYYQNAALFDRTGHLIKLAAITDSTADNAVLSPHDAFALDEKYDDGKADSGAIVALDALDTGGCVTNGTSLSAPSSYLSLDSTRNCRLYFWFRY